MGNADIGTFWCKKLQIYQNLWCDRTDKGVGLEPVRTFCEQEGSLFRDF